jgi:hypothetical protein
VSDREFFSVQELVTMTGCHRNTIYRAIEREELVAERLFGRVLVPVAEWERYRRVQRSHPHRRRPDAARPPRIRVSQRELAQPGSLARLRSIEEAGAG